MTNITIVKFLNTILTNNLIQKVMLQASERVTFETYSPEAKNYTRHGRALIFVLVIHNLGLTKSYFLLIKRAQTLYARLSGINVRPYNLGQVGVHGVTS